MKNTTIRSALRVAAICFIWSFYHSAAAQVRAQNDLFNVLESSCSNYLDVEANDNVGNVTGVQLEIITQPAHGTAVPNGNYISYCPIQGFTGVDNFKYSITVNGVTDSAGIFINVQAFNSFVYPGDADQNGVVENYDVLTIGLTYNSTGPARNDSSSFNALSWPPSNLINSNPAAADCDGNGIVDSQDVYQVQRYYHQTAPVAAQYQVDTSICSNGIPLYMQGTNSDTVANGDTLQITINLGSNGTSNQAYGIAFTLNYDTGFIPRGSIQFLTGASWLLPNNKGLFFSQESTPGSIDIAITNINQLDAQGGGPVLHAIIPIDDNICGITHAPGWYNLGLYASKPRLINKYNEVQALCTQQASIKINKSATGITEERLNAIEIYPNPTGGHIFIKGEKIEQVEITDLAGRKIYSATFGNSSSANIDLTGTGIEPGAYLVQIKTAVYEVVKKIIVQ